MLFCQTFHGSCSKIILSIVPADRKEGGVNHNISPVAPSRRPLLDSFVTKEIFPILNSYSLELGTNRNV